MRIDQKIKQLKKIDTSKIINQIAKKNEAVIVELNTQNQLYEQGIDSLGQKIWSYKPYHPLTVEYKKAVGQPSDRVTLFDRGDYHASFYLQFHRDSFLINARDEKNQKLSARYGKEIKGLTDANLQELIDNYFKPGIIERIKIMI